jgi:hypothetical protein
MSARELRWISAEESARFHQLGVECATWASPDPHGSVREQIESIGELARPVVDDPESVMAIFERFPAWLDGVRAGAPPQIEDEVVVNALRKLAHDLLFELHDYRRREARERRKKQQTLERRRRTIAQRRAAS